MDRDPLHLYPEFRAKVAQILVLMNEYASKHMISYTWKIVEGFRTAEYQNALYQKGRSKPGKIVTYKDGFKKLSNHQSSMAVDIVPFHGHDFDFEGKPEWWDYLGHCARLVGLSWGGDWKSFKDYAHVEWPPIDKATYKKAREWQKGQGLR